MDRNAAYIRQKQLAKHNRMMLEKYPANQLRITLNGGHNVANSYIRARTQAIKNYLDNHPSTREKNSPRELLKNGFVHSEIADELHNSIDKIQNQNFDDRPLMFEEITAFSNWFVLHPEKICGKEKVTTSFHFPIKIEGTKADIIEAIKKGMNPEGSAESELQFELELLEIELDLLLL